MKIVVLWTHLSGYLLANLNAAFEAGHEIHLLHFGDHIETPFGSSLNFSNLNALNAEVFTSIQVRRVIADVGPDLVLVAGWHIQQYRKALLFSPYLVVFYMDNQWKGTFKQKLAVFVRSILIKPRFDFAFLPGVRQQKYALKLGFPQERIWLRALNADNRLFDSYLSSGEIATFLYVGRLSPEKGLVQLLEAYADYRASSVNPWELHVVGDGPLHVEMVRRQGVKWHGFLNQEQTARIYQMPSVFIMPSLRDAWGVAMHEAALTGHPIVATKSCGASDAFVRDKLNGFLFDPGDHAGLVNILRTISSLEQIVLQDFSKMSLELAQTYNPDIWVKSLVEIHESPQATECRRKKKERSRLKDIFRRITKLREHS